MPIWVTAAAQSAAEVLCGKAFCSSQKIALPETEEYINVPVSTSAVFDGGKKALGICFCDPGSGLDLTRGLEIWTVVEYKELANESDSSSCSDRWLEIVGGFGVGKKESTGQICLSEFARNLLHLNLFAFRDSKRVLQVQIIFPRGKELAERTSNRSFGVVEGLSLIGMQAEVQDSASPEQLANTLKKIKDLCSTNEPARDLTFVLGENGLDLALQSGLELKQIIKTGNWLGPLIVAAAEQGVRELLLFGYHGKLIKLAGGIFHTHHHLADSRIEILIALAVKQGMDFDLIKTISKCLTVESAFVMAHEHSPVIAKKLWMQLANEVESRSQLYIQRYVSTSMKIGAVLFDRQRKIRWAGQIGLRKINDLGITLEA